MEALFDVHIAKTYSAINNLDSAMYFLKEADKVHTARSIKIGIVEGPDTWGN